MVKNDTIRPGSYATVAEAKAGGSGGDAVWGSIEGTLNDQTDLKRALDGKQAAGDYATAEALTAGLAGKQDVGDYATSQELSTGLAGKQNTLIAGENITIVDNVISASGDVSAEWGTITGTLADQTDLKNALDGKQDAGDYATESYVDGAVAIVDQEVDDLTEDVTAVESRVTTAEGAIETLVDDVDAVEVRMTTAEGDIDALETSVAGKQDAPETIGTEGQVLGLNEDLEPEWIDVSGGGGDVPENMVTTDTAQTITGQKTFQHYVVVGNDRPSSISSLAVSDGSGGYKTGIQFATSAGVANVIPGSDLGCGYGLANIKERTDEYTMVPLALLEKMFKSKNIRADGSTTTFSFNMGGINGNPSIVGASINGIAQDCTITFDSAYSIYRFTFATAPADGSWVVLWAIHTFPTS